jgi:AcrR family transcriptional regulator
MPEKRPDRRIQRTCQLLFQALLSLIREKGFEALTVQDIIDRANVGRSTFYAHFVDKEDLLVQGMDPFSAGLRERQRRALRAAPGSLEGAFSFSQELFAHAEGHRDVARAMIGKQSAAILQRHFQRTQLELVREEVRSLAPRGSEERVVEAVAQQVAGGLHALLAWWIDGRARLTVEEVDSLFRAMAVAAVRAAFGR